MEPPNGDLRCLGRVIVAVDDPRLGLGFFVFFTPRLAFLLRGMEPKATNWEIARLVQVLRRGRRLGPFGQDQ